MSRIKDLEAAVGKWLDWQHFSYLRISNYRCFKCGQVQNSKAKGWPDYFVYNPVLLAIECKTGKGKLSQDQKRIKGLMEDVGITYIVVRDNVNALLEWADGRRSTRT